MIKQSTLDHIRNSNINVIYPIYEDRLVCSKIQAAIGYDPLEDIDRKLGEVTVIHTLGKLGFNKMYFVGLGKESEVNASRILKAFGKVSKAFKEKEGVADIRRIITDGFGLHELSYLFTEAFTTATYEFVKINGKSKEIPNMEILAAEDVSGDIEKGLIIGEAINHARTLGNMPSNYMTPIDLAEYAKNLAKECNLEATILTNKELKEIGANGILAVNQGSQLEARLIVLKYNGDGDAPYTALIGKGLTFDSGGYNLKPSSSMSTMKSDMCGGANVLSAIEIIAKRKLKANVYAIVPSTENMISGDAYNCCDVIVSLSKKTVEVTNTDAEGRLILMDAITYAQQLGAKRLVDVATLTGAVIVALGTSYTGAFSNNQSFYDSFEKAAATSNEKIWRLPLDENYHDMIKSSKVADLVNSTSGGAGSSTAACFLEEFVENGTKWIHLDIAGTSFDAKYNDLAPKGATGTMAKSMAALFE